MIAGNGKENSRYKRRYPFYLINYAMTLAVDPERKQLILYSILSFGGKLFNINILFAIGDFHTLLNKAFVDRAI